MLGDRNATEKGSENIEGLLHGVYIGRASSKRLRLVADDRAGPSLEVVFVCGKVELVGQLVSNAIQFAHLRGALRPFGVQRIQLMTERDDEIDLLSEREIQAVKLFFVSNMHLQEFVQAQLQDQMTFQEQQFRLILSADVLVKNAFELEGVHDVLCEV